MSLFEKVATGGILGVVGAAVVGVCMNLENLENDLGIINFAANDLLNPITERMGEVTEFFQIVADDTDQKMGIALSNFGHEMAVSADNALRFALVFGFLGVLPFIILMHRRHDHLEAQQAK